MNRLLPAFVLSLVISASAWGQYSNATLSGPWIIIDSPHFFYVIYNGNGTIEQLGSAQDSVHPVGTYTVQPSGTISGTITLINASRSVTGNMLTDSTATVYEDTVLGPFVMFKITDTSALQGSWAGYVYDSSTMLTRQMGFTVSAGGIVAATIGTPLITGKFFAGGGLAAGYITTTDSDCDLKYLQVKANYSGDTMSGPIALGKDDIQSCYGPGYVFFTRLSTGFKQLTAEPSFSVYPVPFTNQLQIKANNTGNKMQVALFDLTGRKLIDKWFDTEPISLTGLEDFAAGMYFLTLSTKGIALSQRVVKQ